MPCGCKKTLCNTKVCKCKKLGEQCAEKCLCQASLCKNRSASDEVRSEALETQVSWRDINNLLAEESELFNGIRLKCGVVPGPLVTIFNQKKNAVKELKGIMMSIEMGNLSLNGQDREVLSAKEWEQLKRSCIKCQSCDRAFLPERIEKHESICLRRTFIVSQPPQKD